MLDMSIIQDEIQESRIFLSTLDALGTSEATRQALAENPWVSQLSWLNHRYQTLVELKSRQTKISSCKSIDLHEDLSINHQLK